MGKYKFVITEHITYNTTIEADNAEEAQERAEHLNTDTLRIQDYTKDTYLEK